MTSPRTLRIGSRAYPVLLPNRRDPRLLVSAVVVSVLVIGIVALDFAVSIPQIFAALLTAFFIDGFRTFRQTGNLVWPASGLNTATGIALILRVVGTEPGDLWSWQGWYYFALVVVLALFTKYAIRYRGTHIFNPSNVALVAAFVVIGSGRIEPLDLWWAPFGPTMAVVYGIILAGGILALRPLRLLAMPVAFWLALMGGLAVLAQSGHCISARWSLQPVCGAEFWWVVVTSPEMLFFLFFMITDPKTIPRSRVARIVVAVLIGLVAALLIAPQTTEFGAKVGLLASLTLISPLRWAADSWFPESVPTRSRFDDFVTRVADVRSRPRTFLRGVIGGGAVAVVALLIVAFGAPARDPAIAAPAVEPVAVEVTVDAAALPAVTVSDDMPALTSQFDADELALMLAEDLAIEAEAMRRAESELLLAADFGPRLEAMQARMAEATATGEWVVADYTFTALELGTVTVPGGQGTDLAFAATGTVTEITYDADGTELHRSSAPVAETFVMRQAADDRWLILDAITRS
ncbi:MAG: hypothetical protein QNJ81_12330 [Acidimicrobiia bacterium]|nr:hypothetical protein [Acidimicrobiia bacterium]